MPSTIAGSTSGIKYAQRGRTHKPKVDSSLKGGWGNFWNSPITPRPHRQHLAIERDNEMRPGGKRCMPQPRKVEKQSRKRITRLPPQPQYVHRGKLILKAPGGYPDRPEGKRHIIDEATGLLKGDLRSPEWDPSTMQPAMKTFGGTKSNTYSQGIVWPLHKDKDGKPIDYALARNGGTFKNSYLRGTIVKVPVEEPPLRPALKNGAVFRHREERYRSDTRSALRSTGSRLVGPSSMSAKDRHIVKLRAELALLKK